MHMPPNLTILGILEYSPELYALTSSQSRAHKSESMSSSQEVISKKDNLDNCLFLNMNTGDLGRWLSGYRICCASTRA